MQSVDQHMMMKGIAGILLSMALMAGGCAGLVSAPKVTTSCSFDQAWSLALASLEEFEIRRIDQGKGTIDTDWVVVQAMTEAGVLRRDVNKERVRFFLKVVPENGGASVAVHQLREQWSPMGVRYREWRRIPPLEDEQARLARRIHQRLKARQC